MKMLNKNYKGEIAIRDITPISISFQTSEWHGAAWHLEVFDNERSVRRLFNLKECSFLNASSRTLRDVSEAMNDHPLGSNRGYDLEAIFSTLDREEIVHMIADMIVRLDR